MYRELFLIIILVYIFDVSSWLPNLTDIDVTGPALGLLGLIFLVGFNLTYRKARDIMYRELFLIIILEST